MPPSSVLLRSCTDTCPSSWGNSLGVRAHTVAPRLMRLSALGTRRPRGSDSGSCCHGLQRSIRLDPASAQGRSCCHLFYLHMPHASLVCFCSGKSNPYCEISMGSQSYTTRTLPDTLNPKWNFNCQFFIKDLYQDVLCLTMFDRDQFSPDGKV